MAGRFRGGLFAAQFRKAKAGQARVNDLLPLPQEGRDAPLLKLAPGLNQPAPKRQTKQQVERPYLRRALGFINSHIVDGVAFHVRNEEPLLSLLPKERRHRYQQAMVADGVWPGAPDIVVLWKFPDAYRKALEAAGFKLPPFMALAGTPEVKPPDWHADTEWRNGEQPKAHARLRSIGVPVEIISDEIDTYYYMVDAGIPMRSRLLAPRPEPRDRLTPKAELQAKVRAAKAEVVAAEKAIRLAEKERLRAEREAEKATKKLRKNAQNQLAQSGGQSKPAGTQTTRRGRTDASSTTTSTSFRAGAHGKAKRRKAQDQAGSRANNSR